MKNRINFTKDNIDALPLPETGKRDVYHDTKKSGLQIRVTSKGVKTFCFYGRIKGGKPERVTLGKYPVMSIGNAREKAASIGGLAAQGISTSEAVRSLRSDTTLQELFDDFLENRRNRSGAYLSDKTKRSYRYDFGLYLAKWGKRKLSQFNDTDFDKLHTDVGKIHPTTANRIIALASSLFSFAGERKFFTGENPARGIKKFKETKRDRFIYPDELPRFFEALASEPSDTMRDYFLLSLLTGARRSNVLAMAWKDIHLGRGEWRIAKTKNGEPQTVTLTAEAVEILQSRKDGQTEWVFPSQTSQSGHIEEPKKAWKALLGRAGLENLRIHDLRRTLGSWQARTGASLVTIGKSLNHKSPSTTAIYAHLDLDPVRESVDRATSAMLVAGGIKPGGQIISLKKKAK